MSFVYFVRCGCNVKIGYARNVPLRMSQIQCASAVQIELAAQVHGGRKLEKKLHAKFAHARVRGEWFRETPEITKAIEWFSRHKRPTVAQVEQEEFDPYMLGIQRLNIKPPKPRPERRYVDPHEALMSIINRPVDWLKKPE